MWQIFYIAVYVLIGIGYFVCNYTIDKCVDVKCIWSQQPKWPVNVYINSIVMLTVSCSIKLKVFFLADHTTVLHFSSKMSTSSIDFTSTVHVCFVSKGQLFELHVFTIVQYHVITIILYFIEWAPRCLINIWLKGGALIWRRAFNQGGAC